MKDFTEHIKVQGATLRSRQISLCSQHFSYASFDIQINLFSYFCIHNLLVQSSYLHGTLP